MAKKFQLRSLSNAIFRVDQLKIPPPRKVSESRYGSELCERQKNPLFSFAYAELDKIQSILNLLELENAELKIKYIATVCLNS